MKKISIIIITVLFGVFSIAKAQENIQKDSIEKITNKIKTFLPEGWIVKIVKENQNEILIQSLTPIDLSTSMTANDPPEVKDLCEIYILIVKRVSPDSIKILRENNEKLKNNLPPQISKDNLKKWYQENEKTLKTLDSEPTHYDDNYSYRIKCERLPKEKKDLEDYEKIMGNINILFKKYE